MRFDGILIQVLATLMLVAGVVLTGYALLQPQQSDTTYTLSVEQVNENEPGVRSESVEYSDLSREARIAFGRAKFKRFVRTPREASHTVGDTLVRQNRKRRLRTRYLQARAYHRADGDPVR
ncbi:hypothetical protein [Haladaptatus sp. NG-SE-30]